MKHTIILSSNALMEEAKAFLFYENQSDGLGERFLKEIEEYLKKVSENPDHYSFSDSTKTLRDVALKKFLLQSSTRLLMTK